MLKKTIVCLAIMVSGLSFSSCASGNTVKVVKPKKHWRPYNQAKDRRKKRIKVVRMKS